jgi:hypothetical protein
MLIKTTGWEDYLDPAGGSWVKCLVMGPPDVGKTRSASFWPSPIFADCEKGRMSLADRKVPYAEITSTADMDALIEQMKFDAKRPPEKRKYRTLVIDTVDHYQKIVINERLRKENKERLEGWADWGWLDAIMQQFVEKVLNLPMNVIMNVHFQTITEGDDDDKAKRTFQKLRLKGDVKEWLLEEFDLIGMMESSYKAVDGQRIRTRHVRWHNEPAYPLLKDRSGSLPQFTDIDFTDEDYYRVFNAITSKVDDLPESETVEEIEVQEDPVAEPVGTDVQGGPVDPGKLPEKRVAAKKTVAKKVAAKTRDAAPGEATIVDPSEKGTKDMPVTVDANKAVLENLNHAHAKDGTCLKNRFGHRCGSVPAPPQEEPAGLAAPAAETGTPVDAQDSGTNPDDPAVALVKDELGATEVEQPKPQKYCGKQPDSHKKFPAVNGCGKDLDTEIPAKVNLALLRAKTMLCTDCFENWKAEQSA